MPNARRHPRALPARNQAAATTDLRRRCERERAENPERTWHGHGCLRSALCARPRTPDNALVFHRVALLLAWVTAVVAAVACSPAVPAKIAPSTFPLPSEHSSATWRNPASRWAPEDLSMDFQRDQANRLHARRACAQGCALNGARCARLGRSGVRCAKRVGVFSTRPGHQNGVIRAQLRQQQRRRCDLFVEK